jgi:hypothetical protein
VAEPAVPERLAAPHFAPTMGRKCDGITALLHDRLGLRPAQAGRVGCGKHVYIESVRPGHRLEHRDGLRPVARRDVEVELNLLIRVVAALILVGDLASCKGNACVYRQSCECARMQARLVPKM